MNVTLREEDGRALDLLLDRTPAAGTDGAVFAPAAGGQLAPERVRGAERILGLLQWLPETDPPRDLVARTMRFIDTAATERLGDRTGVGAAMLMPSAQPHA